MTQNLKDATNERVVKKLTDVIYDYKIGQLTDAECMDLIVDLVEGRV